MLEDVNKETFARFCRWAYSNCVNLDRTFLPPSYRRRTTVFDVFLLIDWATDTERLRTPNDQFGVPVTHPPHVYIRALRASFNQQSSHP